MIPYCHTITAFFADLMVKLWNFLSIRTTMNELIAKLKKLSIFKHKWVQFLMYLIKNFIDDNCSQKAALLTYTTLLSIVPILTLLVVILSTIPQLAEAREQIQNLIFSNILPSTGLQVTKYLNQFTSNSSNLTKFGVLKKKRPAGSILCVTGSLLPCCLLCLPSSWLSQVPCKVWVF